MEWKVDSDTSEPSQPGESLHASRATDAGVCVSNRHEFVILGKVI